MRILASTISEINERLRDLLSNYVHFGTGRQQYALCPLPTHSERTPSFSYHKTKRVWKCFGCGAGGDAIKFIRLIHPEKTFIEAVELAGEILSIPIEYEDGNGNKAQRKPREIAEEPFETLDRVILKSKIELTKTQSITDNPLLSGMAEMFSEEIVRTIIERYTITFKGDWIQFPQIDLETNYRTGKYIKYLSNGHRCKETNPRWAHTGITDKYKQCLTGLHLLKYFPTKQVAIIEGPSTMLFMACLSLAAEEHNISQLKIFTNYIWLSSGAASGVNIGSHDVAKDLKSRRVTLYPDTGAYDTWLKYIDPLKSKGVDASISAMLEQAYANGKLPRNTDLRDYFSSAADAIKDLMCSYPPEWDLPAPITEWHLQNMAVNLEYHFNNKDMLACNALAEKHESRLLEAQVSMQTYLGVIKEHAPLLSAFLNSSDAQL